MTLKQIEVWHDKTSSDAAPRWCVSLCDSCGEEVLTSHDVRHDAIDAACDAARDMGLGVYERSTYGPLTEIASAGELRGDAD